MDAPDDAVGALFKAYEHYPSLRTKLHIARQQLRLSPDDGVEALRDILQLNAGAADVLVMLGELYYGAGDV